MSHDVRVIDGGVAVFEIFLGETMIVVFRLVRLDQVISAIAIAGRMHAGLAVKHRAAGGVNVIERTVTADFFNVIADFPLIYYRIGRGIGNNPRRLLFPAAHLSLICRPFVVPP